MDLKSALMGLSFAAIWASAFTSTRIAVVEMPPLLALVIRFAISAVIAIALARAMGQTMRLTRAEWRTVVVFGVCQNALYLGLNWVGMQWIEASAASIIASMMPLLWPSRAGPFWASRCGARRCWGWSSGWWASSSS